MKTVCGLVDKIDRIDTSGCQHGGGRGWSTRSETLQEAHDQA